MVSRFNSIVAYLDTNVIYFGQLMSGAEQYGFCFVTVQYEKVLSHPDVDFVDALLILAIQLNLEFDILGLNER